MAVELRWTSKAFTPSEIAISLNFYKMTQIAKLFLNS